MTNNPQKFPSGSPEAFAEATRWDELAAELGNAARAEATLRRLRDVVWHERVLGLLNNESLADRAEILGDAIELAWREFHDAIRQEDRASVPEWALATRLLEEALREVREALTPTSQEEPKS